MCASNHIAWPYVLAGSMLLTPTVAHAQEVNPEVLEAAQKHYERGVALMDAKNFAKGCPELERVTALVPTGIGGRQALAECYEGWGKLASAWRQHVEIETLAQIAGDAPAAADARLAVARLRPQLATIRIFIPNTMQGLPGASIVLDRAPLSPSSWGVKIPADLGKHVIFAGAPGRLVWGCILEITVLGEEKVVNVPQLEESKEEAARSPPSWMSPAGFAALGLGVGVGGTAVYWAHSLTREDREPNALGILGLVSGGFMAGSALLLAASYRAPDNSKKDAGLARWGVSVAPTRIGMWGAW